MKIKTLLLRLGVVIFSSLLLYSSVYGQPGTVEGAGAVSGSGGSRHNAPASRIIDTPFLEAVSSVENHIVRFYDQVAGFQALPATLKEQWDRVAQTHSPSLLLLLIFLTIAASISGEYGIRRLCSSLHEKLALFPPDDLFSRISHTGAAICLELIYAAGYILISFVLYVILIPHESAPHLIGSHYIIASYYIRLLVLISTVMLSPRRPSLRILPYSNKAASFLFTWITILCGLEIVLVRSGIILRKLIAPDNTFLALVAIIIISTAVALAFMVIRSRHWVSDALRAPQSSGLPLLPAQLAFARIWHVPALIFVLFITLIWEYRVLGSSQVLFGRVIMGLLTIPLFGALDIWGGQLFSFLIRKTGQNRGDRILPDDNETAPPGRRSFTTYLQYIQILYRILLLTLMAFLLLGLWDLDFPYGRMFTGSILGVVAIVVFSYMIWQLFSDWIDHKIKAEMPDDDDEADEGGKGGSRTGTLLILLRKFTYSLLIILAVMFILSAFGLDIGPLIAGAGIIGLAISFGAQSLVTDIFAGIFFLIDDAFRVGDYIDIGTAKGTVDHISLRSVRLRHHLGMVQTIPFGKIDTVTNYSRDYIISKLDLRVKYDTDVDTVRKLVKSIYQEISVDEFYGPKLTGKLKSQGIRQMDDSAMIVRVKFTTQPGEQFMMRREIYRRIQEKFADSNIEFAHRNVTVYMPEEHDRHDQSRDTISGAAAGRLLLDDEDLANDLKKEDSR